jgi:hypothetical protein
MFVLIGKTAILSAPATSANAKLLAMHCFNKLRGRISSVVAHAAVKSNGVDNIFARCDSMRFCYEGPARLLPTIAKIVVDCNPRCWSSDVLSRFTNANATMAIMVD